MLFNVQFTGKQNGTPVNLTLAVDVDHAALKLDPAVDGDFARLREYAWDAFKTKSSLRRWTGDSPPVITVATPIVDAILAEQAAAATGG